MQDIGPDMEELLYQASEEYPLKDPPDKWQAIHEAVNEQQASMRKNRYMPVFLPAGLLTLLVMIGLIVGDAERMAGDGLIPVQQVTKQIESVSSEQKDSSNQSIVRQKNVVSENKMAFVGSHEQKSAIPQNTLTSSTPIRNIKSSELKLNVANINPAERVSELISTDVKNLNFHHSNQNSPAQQTARIRNKGLYYGVLAGLDANAVKDQPFGNIKLEVGAILGYRFSRSFSVESGISMVKKYYSTRGEYFSMDEMGGMPGAEMMEVKGSSKVIRIPMHIRTDIFCKRTGRLFSSFGISSYILTEENNQYDIMMNGSEEKMFASYSRNKNYFAATADVSFGYERQLGNNQVKVQPYLQMPVKGIGIGKLPIKSAGIRVGLTRGH